MSFFNRRPTPPSHRPPPPTRPGGCLPLCTPVCQERRSDECPPSCLPPCPLPPRRDPCDPPPRLGARIVCCGREAQRCMPLRIAVSGLPCGMVEPLRLVAIEPQGEPAVCVREACRGPSPAVAELTVPVNAWVRDACGRTCCGCAEVVVCVRIASDCLCGRGTFMATADIRLIDGGACACGAAFDVRAQVCAEVYMVRMEPRRGARDCDIIQPFMSQRPFYPQPWYY